MEQENTKNVTTPDDMEILFRTRDHNPVLYNRVMELLTIVDDRKPRTADDVEFQVIDTLRNMGKDVLTSWSENQASEAASDMLEKRPDLKLNTKKNFIGKPPMEK